MRENSNNHKIFEALKTTIMNCVICNLPLNGRTTIVDGFYASLFHRTCMDCSGQCHSCGYECGFVRSNLITDERCDFCEHDTCKCCKVNVRCDCGCGQVACTDCTYERSDEMCKGLEVAMENLLVAQKNY